MPAVRLDDRALIDVAGPEAEHFLQNIVTTDLDVLKAGEAKPGALLTPQGKILFDFLISRHGDDGFVLDCRADAAEAFIKRLMLYRLRAKVQISQRDESVVGVEWGDESSVSDNDPTRLRDGRFGELKVFRGHSGKLGKSEAQLADWTLLRIRHGVAESGSDYALGDAFPHDVLLDRNGGVGFRKGCYVGQEVVSRMQHRGTARRRVLITRGDSDLAGGAELRAAGKPVGSLGSAVGAEALAIARIDKVKQAMDSGEAILAGDVPVRLTIPGWAGFDFPEDTPAEGG